MAVSALATLILSEPLPSLLSLFHHLPPLLLPSKDHRALSFVEQEEVKPKPKELGSEQGDVRWSIGVLENGSWSSVGRCGTTSGWKIKYQRNIYHVSDLENTPFAENISEVRALATVVVAVHVNITLWVAVRPRGCIADQLYILRVHGHTILAEEAAAKNLQ